MRLAQVLWYRAWSYMTGWPVVLVGGTTSEAFRFVRRRFRFGMYRPCVRYVGTTGVLCDGGKVRGSVFLEVWKPMWGTFKPSAMQQEPW